MDRLLPACRRLVSLTNLRPICFAYRRSEGKDLTVRAGGHCRRIGIGLDPRVQPVLHAGAPLGVALIGRKAV